jgi:hypothetical protein
MISLSWEDMFFCLVNKRLRLRAIAIGVAMTARPGAAMTSAFDDWKETRNAYNFFSNKRMSLQTLLDPPTRALALKLRELPEGATMLNVRDTSEINLSHLIAMTGLGPIGNPKNRGLFMHPGLVVDTDGVPVGLLGLQTWTRPVEEHGKVETRRGRAFEEKESLRWWTDIERAEKKVQRPGLLLHVGDRESDIYALFERCHAAGHRLLARAAQDRRVDGEHRLLWDHMEALAECAEHRDVEVAPRRATKDKPAQPARTATVAIRFGPVTLCAPHQGQGSVPAWSILVREVDPPEGVEPLEWLLLTLDPITTEQDAWTRVTWYRFRWVIEEFFKVLKSQCRIEERQFETLETFEVSLGMSILTAVKLLELTKRARIDPELPASTVLSTDEERLLVEHAETYRDRTPAPLRLGEAVMLIAMLGGYKARSCDGPPGWSTLGKGYQHLCAMVDGYQLALGRPRPPRGRPPARRKVRQAGSSGAK